METLIDLVRSGAERFGPRPALLIRPFFRTRTWRYRDLATMVPKAARVLAEAGVEPGDRVILWAVNRPEWGIAFFSLAHLGAVSVPLDVRHTVDFGRKIVKQTDAKLVIASRQTEASARELGLPMVFVETLPDLARRVTPVEAATVTGATLAEIVFTSGTTGEPKGAMLSHGNLMASATAMTQVLSFGERDRLLSVLPLSHLYEQVLGFMAPLTVGASIVPRESPAIGADPDLPRLSRLGPADRAPGPEAARRGNRAAGRPGRPPCGLRAAPPNRSPVAPVRAPPAVPVRPGAVRRAPPHHRRGRVGAGCRRRQALDRDGHRHPPGLRRHGDGPRRQLHAAGTQRPRDRGRADPGRRRADRGGRRDSRPGPGRFAGYWKNPEATAAAIDAEGWYHTGDLGAIRNDGMLTFRGRKKDMLALPDGQKVYAEDVEAILKEDSRVKDAAIVGWPLGGGLKVHAVLLLGDAGDEEPVVRDANVKLAPHQQIRGSTRWPDDDLPRTHTLKVRKPDIPRLEDLERPASAPIPAAASKLQPAPLDLAIDPITVIVAGLAGRDPVTVERTARLSTDLDLDSLQRVELLGIIEEETGVFVDDDLLQPDTTVVELIALVDAARDAKRSIGAWRWPLSPFVRASGLAIQILLIYPFVHLFYRVRVTGLERLREEDGPYLLTPNHCLHLDNGIILSRLPLGIRWKLAVAAAADTIYDNRLQVRSRRSSPTRSRSSGRAGSARASSCSGPGWTRASTS